MSDIGTDPGARDNVLFRLSERVTRLEATQESVQRDTAAIRSTQHDINNELQKLVAADYRLANSLETLAKDQTRAAEEALRLAASVNVMAEKVKEFVDMKTDLANIIRAEHRTIGAWGLATRVGTIVTAIIAAAGVLYTIFGHAVGH